MGDGSESINWKKYWDFLGAELGIIISAGQSNWEVLWFGQGLRKHEVATGGCGKKSNEWVLEIKFCWSEYRLILSWGCKKLFYEFFINLPNLFISSFIHSHLFIDSLTYLSLNEFCKFY